MAAISLSAYTFRVKDSKSGKNVTVGRFGDKHDLLLVLETFLSSLKAKDSHDSVSKQLLSVTELNLDAKNRILTGVIESGQYGSESKIKDLDSRAVVHHKTVNHAEMLPFYFLFSVPVDKDEGVVILQRMGQFGIRKLIGKEIKTLFETGYLPFVSSIQPLIPEEVVRKTLEKGLVTKLRFVRFGVHKDIADAYDAHDHREEVGNMQLVVSARRGKSMPIIGRLLEVVSGKRSLQNMIELEDFKYDTVKVEVNVNGRKRTVNLGELQKTRAYYDIDLEVQKGANGQPVFASIDGIARQLLVDITEQLLYDVA